MEVKVCTFSKLKSFVGFHANRDDITSFFQEDLGSPRSGPRIFQVRT